MLAFSRPKANEYHLALRLGHHIDCFDMMASQSSSSFYVYYTYGWPASSGVVAYASFVATPTSCLVNIIYSGDSSKPTPVLADSKGNFLVNDRGAFIRAESSRCIPYTGENAQTITVTPIRTERPWRTAPIYSSPGLCNPQS